MPVIQFREALRDAMTEEMDRDENVFLMGEEVAQYNGAYKVSEGMLEKFGPAACSTPPSAKPAFAGLGVGAACCGLRPIIEFMSWSFTLVCLDQLVNNAANIRYMSGGQFKIPVVFRGGNGIAHQLGATHSHRMESVYARIPGLIVVTPSTPVRRQGLAEILHPLRRSGHLPGIRKNARRKGRSARRGISRLPIGMANVEREGTDVTVISYGRPLQRVVRPAVEQSAGPITASTSN